MLELRTRCDEVRRSVSLSAIAGASMKLRRSGREWKACCPFHPDRSPSFTIYAEDTRFMCFGCGAEGDVLDFVMRLRSIALREALQMLDATRLGRSAPQDVASRAPPSHQPDRSREALRVWDRAKCARGTIAEDYLRSRGIAIAIPTSIRFANLCLGQRGPMPTLVAAMSTLEGEVFGIQRTFLSADPVGKAKLPGGKSKFSLGRVRGSAIRLGVAERALIVTEGLEDGLSLVQTLGRPVWVAAGAGMMPAMRLPEIVQKVIIGADNDEAGEEAAQRAAKAFASTGRVVGIMRPGGNYKDFNEWLVAVGGA
ncbi:MAG: toprim domain-containing protein [Alphaproteobacteria bacterium]|nr:MAG: toprim domain-containing protein [Alphaproteobacteria bacterium]